MNKDALQQARAWIKRELFESCLPFWQKNAPDARYGGIFTCLDRRGSLYGTDKSVWFQGRAAWIFARLCNVYGPRAEWLAAAQSCIDFMDAHCFVPGTPRMYFTVTRAGAPLRLRRYHFSELFYAMACAEYAAAAQRPEYVEKARAAFRLAWGLYTGSEKDISGIPPKTEPATRRTISLSEPLMFLNTASILRRFDAAQSEEYSKIARACADTVLRRHIKPELKAVLENVGENGEVLREFPAGRLMNPGHVIEAGWFMLEEAAFTGDAALRGSAADMFSWGVARGWDEEYGGLRSFVDIDGCPPEQYEHDMKFWWPHTEMLIAALMLCRDTADERWLACFWRALNYCKAHFCDAEYGEWYGYLHRDGSPTLPAVKGTLFKGPFHLPRMLIAADGLLGDLLEQ